MDPSTVQKHAHGIFRRFFFFSSGNGSHLAKGASCYSHRDVPSMWHESQYNHTQHHYRKHDAHISALKNAGRSLKHIVRDGTNRKLNLSLTVCMTNRLSCEAFFGSCLSFDLASCLVVSGHASTQTCVCTDRPVYTSGGALQLPLVLQALLAPFRRLPLTTLSREPCLCTWRLTRMWTDVRIFLHLCTASD